MKSARLALAALVLTICLSAVRSQVMPPEPQYRDQNRWRMADNDVLLLVRKVDDPHPYFKSMTFRPPQNNSASMATLTRMLSMHCNTSNITQLVKNDLLILKTNEDVNGLISGDKIEIWSNSSGQPTRAATILSFPGNQRGRLCRFPAPGIPIEPKEDGRGPPRDGSGPHHRGRGPRRGDRRWEDKEGDDDRRGRRLDGRKRHRGGRRREREEEDDRFFF